MLAGTIQLLESRFELLVAAYRELKVANATLIVERDGLLRERQFMREELDRILSRFAKIEDETS